MFNWQKGRQNTGYEKLKIFQFLTFDCYILRYKVGDSIPIHTDPVPGYRHFRFNWTIKNAEEGGYFMVRRWHDPDLELVTIIHSGPFTFFRPDIIPHYVLPILKGERIVLTFGVCLPI